MSVFRPQREREFGQPICGTTNVIDNKIWCDRSETNVFIILLRR